MLPADEFQEVCDGLWSWQRYQPAVKVDCSSSALRVGGKLIFIDPIPLAADALAELGKPAAIIATNGNHGRAIAKFREQFGVPVIAHGDASPTLGLDVHTTVADGQLIFETLTVIAIPGAAAGEIALYDARGWLIVGDALINLEPDGLALLPDKYCLNPREMRIGLQKLLRFPFQVLTFAHGLPLAVHARPRLEALLA